MVFYVFSAQKIIFTSFFIKQTLRNTVFILFSCMDGSIIRFTRYLRNKSTEDNPTETAYRNKIRSDPWIYQADRKQCPWKWKTTSKSTHFTLSVALAKAIAIDQFRYIKIQPKTIDLSTRLMGITTEFVGFIPKSLVLKSIVLGWILIYRKWSIPSLPCPVIGPLLNQLPTIEPTLWQCLATVLPLLAAVISYRFILNSGWLVQPAIGQNWLAWKKKIYWKCHRTCSHVPRLIMQNYKKTFQITLKKIKASVQNLTRSFAWLFHTYPCRRRHPLNSVYSIVEAVRSCGI